MNAKRASVLEWLDQCAPDYVSAALNELIYATEAAVADDSTGMDHQTRLTKALDAISEVVR